MHSEKRPAPNTKKDDLNVEPGADKRLADILKRALNTPPRHKSTEKSKKSDKRGS